MKLVSMKKLRNRKGYSTVKNKDITLLTKIHIVKAIVFPVGHIYMWELDYKEDWEPRIDAF